MKNMLSIIFGLIWAMAAFFYNLNTKDTSLSTNTTICHPTVLKVTTDMSSIQAATPCELSISPLRIDSIQIIYWYTNEVTIMIDNYSKGYAYVKKNNENSEPIMIPEKLCSQIYDLVNLIFIQKEKPVIEFRTWHPEMVSTDISPIILFCLYADGKCYERVIEYLTRIDHYDYKYSSDFTRLADIILDIYHHTTK